ncbi:MAG: hypothetical protein IPG58_07150 [Acidobacteria bacterium]|nr:hypothetical protein [Acidobacteriota bacterium]
MSNLVGGNDGIIFDGASLIADEQGDIILQAAAFEFVETVELDVRKPDAEALRAARSIRYTRHWCSGSAIMRRRMGLRRPFLA